MYTQRCVRDDCQGFVNPNSSNKHCTAVCRWVTDQAAVLTTRLTDPRTKNRAKLEEQWEAVQDIREGLDRWTLTFGRGDRP